MSLVGMGRAFNLRFMPNGPLRTNCYHRPMPHIGFFGGGGNMSYTENINIQNGPTGFWGFMTGLTQGLFGGGMFGCGMGGGLFGLLNSQKATPQGTDQAQGGEDKHLKNLQQAYGKKYEIVSHPDKKGIYQAFPKGGGKPIEGTYDDLCTKLAEEKEEPTVEQHHETETDAQKLAKAQKEAADKNDPKLEKVGDEWVAKDDHNRKFEWKGGIDGHFEEIKKGTLEHEDPGHHDVGGGGGVGGTGHGTGKHGVKVPAGWYRAPKGGDGQAMIENQSLRTGMSARQVTDIILNNKVNYLSTEDRNKLAAEVERYNPSIFKNGKVVDGADLSKLDIPSIDYIKNKYVNHDKMSTTSGTREARGTYRSSDGTSNTVGQTVTSKTGRYAKQINGQWHYYAKDGTELNETHIKNNDPDLWAKTHPNAGTLGHNHQQQGPLSNHLRR